MISSMFTHTSLILKSLHPEFFFGFFLLLLLLATGAKHRAKTAFEPCAQTQKHADKYEETHILSFDNEIKNLFFLAIIFTCYLTYSCNITTVLEFNTAQAMFYNTPETYALKTTFLIISIIALIPISIAAKYEKLPILEFYFLIGMAILASLLLISSRNLLQIYVLLELQALSFYTLAALKTRQVSSIEAGLKYFIYGSITSIFFLLGTSYIYGLFGTLDIYEIHIFLKYLTTQENAFLIFICIFFLLITLFFKIGIFPFNLWLPDVYDGAPIASTIFFLIIPKLPIFDLFYKILIMVNNTYIWTTLEFLIYTLATLTIIIGSFATLKQSNLKRFIIYSTIAQLGFPVIAATIIFDTYTAILYYYLILYLINAIALWAFYILISFNRIGPNQSMQITDLTNLAEHNPILFYSFALNLFALAKLPPSYTFISKTFILNTLIEKGYAVFAFLTLICSIVSAFYYLRVIKINIAEPTKPSAIINKTFNFGIQHFASNKIDEYLLSLILISNIIVSFAFVFLSNDYLEILIFLLKSGPFK